MVQMLPGAGYNLNKHEDNEFKFKGIRHTEGARDGDIYDMENTCLDDYPSLSARKARKILPFEIEGNIYGIGSGDKLFWCSGESDNVKFHYDGEAKFSVSATEKTFAVINKYVCIFPDKLYFSLWNEKTVGTYATLEELQSVTETDATLKDGAVYAVGTTEPYSYFQFNSQGKWVSDATTENHAVQTRWIYLMDSWGRLSDSLTVTKGDDLSKPEFSTGTRHFDDAGRKYFAVRDIGGKTMPWLRSGDSVKITSVEKDGKVSTLYTKLYGKEVVEDLIGDYTYGVYYFDPEFGVSASNYDSVTIEREVPDLKFSFCHDNRLWGVSEDKIYASKLGDPFNFQDYTLSADASWTVGVVSSGEFTGAIAYNGYPTFFKEDRIIRVSGNYPSQYSTFETADISGVMKGADKSLAITDGRLFYLSADGVCAYSGSYPYVISDDLGEVLSEGKAGTDSYKYYLEAKSKSGEYVLYVYDTRHSAWTKENATEAIGFTSIDRELYAITEKGIYLLDSIKDEEDKERKVKSFVTFAPIYEGKLYKKGLSKLHLSIKVDSSASVVFYISYDGGEFKEVKSIDACERNIYNIPLTIRRCGYYQIKIEATGGFTLYGIGRVRYFGSDM